MAETTDPMNESIDWTVLDRYYAGELDDAQAAQVRRWLMAHAGEQRILDLVGQALDGRPTMEPRAQSADVLGVVTEANARTSWRQVQAKLHAEKPTLTNHRRGWRGIPVTRAALRMMIPVGLSVFAVSIWLVSKSGFVLAHTRVHEGPSRAYATRNGERATVTLPDGSTVLLRDATTLVVPSQFGRGERMVTLRGEAYFTVMHTAGAPFSVRSGNVMTRVLGTAFDVRTYPGDTTVRVVVASGRVVLGTASGVIRSARQIWRGAAILNARMMGQVSDSGVVAVAPSGIAVDDALAWMRGMLVFRDMPLQDALPEIGRRYDLVFRLADSTLQHETLTATFGEEPVTQVLDGLALAFHAHYTRSGPEGRVITFTPARRLIQRAAPVRMMAPSLTQTEAPYGR